MWKCGNAEICVERFNRKRTNLGSLEMWKYVLNGLIVNVLSLVVWKCGNVEMRKYALNGLIVNLLILQVWKCRNVEICVERFNRLHTKGPNALD